MTFVDIRDWFIQAASPTRDGNFPLSERIGGGLARFFGYEHVSVSSITINSIVVASTSNEAPKALLASASNVSAIGSRLLSSLTLNPYQDLEYRWTLAYSDDSPIEDLEGIVDPRDSTTVNPYTDQVSPEATFILREAGSYKLTLIARGMSATSLEVIEQTATTTVTVTESTQDHLWYDGSSGNDANDGLDPWGFGLTTAVYTEVTGELTQAGAFSSYVHDTSVNFTDRDNYIYISKAGFEGLYRIASKTSNDTIVLEQKLGSDQVAVTSSDGAKQTFSGTVISGTNHHLKGGNTYTVTNTITPNQLANPIAVSAYNGVPKVTSAATDLISLTTNASGSLPSYIRFSGVNFDAEGNASTIFGVNTSTVDTATTTVILDRMNAVNSDSETGVNIQSAPSVTKLNHVVMYGIYIDNRYGTTGKAASRQGLFTNLLHDSWARLLGSTIDADCDSSTLDHFYYPNGKLNHFHAAFNNFRDGTGASYAMNINSSDVLSEYVSINNNFAGNNSDWFIDASNSNNEDHTKYFQNFVCMNNKVNVKKGLTFHYALQDSMFSYNQSWVSSLTQAMFTLDDTSTALNPDNFTGVMHNNDVYGQKLIRLVYGTAREIVDNEAYHTDDNDIFNFTPASLGAREFIAQGNNLYAPNKAGGTPIQSDGVDITMAAFNASSADISGNTETLPSWTDPANGVFNGTPLGLEVTVV